MKSIHVARAHRQHQLFVGWGTSTITMIALALNTLVVPAGLIALAFAKGWPGWAIVIFSAVIGIVLALASDIMTLTSAARLRKAFEEKKEIKASFALIPLNERTPAIRAMQREQESALTPRFWLNGFLIVFCSVSSGSAGDIFWQHFLAGKLQDWQIWTASTVFSLIISWIMISSEIYRRDNEDLIKESIKEANFTSIAAQQDANDSAAMILNARYAKGVKVLAEETPVIDTAVEGSIVEIYDDLLMGGQGRLQLRMRQERDSREYAQLQDAEKTRAQLRLIEGGKQVEDEEPQSNYERVKAYMIDNPGCINKDIEAAFSDIPSKTVRTYAARVRKDLAG